MLYSLLQRDGRNKENEDMEASVDDGLLREAAEQKAHNIEMNLLHKQLTQELYEFRRLLLSSATAEMHKDV